MKLAWRNQALLQAEEDRRQQAILDMLGLH
jgi:hypothetical protein